MHIARRFSYNAYEDTDTRTEAEARKRRHIVHGQVERRAQGIEREQGYRCVAEAGGSVNFKTILFMRYNLIENFYLK